MEAGGQSRAISRVLAFYCCVELNVQRRETPYMQRLQVNGRFALAEPFRTTLLNFKTRPVL